MTDDKKKLFLVFHGRFPSNKAASLFAGKSAETFASAGMDVVLVVPRRIGRETGDPYKYYGFKKNFRIKYLPVLDTGRVKMLEPFRFWLSFLTFSLSSFLYLVFAAGRRDIIYSNETLPLFLSSFLFSETFFEMHDFPESKFGFFGFFLRRIRFILIHNRWKEREAVDKFGLKEERVICEPNAVDPGEFDLPISKEESRKILGLNQGSKIAIYTGHLYGWKGVDTLALAAEMLPHDYEVYFVGGTEEDEEKFREKYGSRKNIKIAGFRPHSEIPLWQKAADVLILPNTGKEDISRYYTSPMKFFEYAASRRPVVASRVESITELSGDTRAYLVEPDNPKALADGIVKVCGDPALSERISSLAYEWIGDHTWEKRAERIVGFIEK